MLLSATIKNKSFGSTTLYTDIQFDIQDGEKIGLIGRNGTGKSTLFGIITGDDKDFEGNVLVKKNTVVISSRQEHHGHEDKTVLEYIQGDLPEYSRLTNIIDTYPDTMGTNPRRLQEFSDAIERFEHLGYYQIEDELKQAFETYQLDASLLHRSLKSLSGGQKRMVELIKVQRSRGHVALIDEPTNHMDYVAKQAFISWLKAADESVLVITHDRDVLAEVDRIIEIRDGKNFNFRGNYNSYLKINKNQVTAQVNEYDLTQRRIDNLQQDVIRFQRLKEKSRTPGTIKRFKSQELKARTELEMLQGMEKPSFWIDQESTTDMTKKLSVAYDKYKAQNIQVNTRKKDAEATDKLLVSAQGVSLGYGDTPLFEGIDFQVHTGERLRFHGRNGAGKTTLVQAILSQIHNTPLVSRSFAGTITSDPEVRVGLYEQEIESKYLELTLSNAIERIYDDKDLPINPQKIKQLLSSYLFNPMVDGDMLVSRLSGGQKARLQLIAMLANDPELLILDEPTNHLDLPSIEELEQALQAYHGAIIYISHDSFFARKLGGKTVAIGR